MVSALGCWWSTVVENEFLWLQNYHLYVVARKTKHFNMLVVKFMFQAMLLELLGARTEM